MKHLVIAATIISSTLMACSSNQEYKETANTVTQQVSADSNTAATQQAGEAAVALPSFTLEDVNGNKLNLQQLKGKKVFVNLWASWCPPCRREMPSIEKLSQSVDTNKVTFVLLSLDDNFDKAKAFIKRQHLDLPIYYPAEELPALFNVQGIPTTFIFDEKGNLVKRVDGGDDYTSAEYRQLFQ